ncbi:MAG: SulP family inorganic anion transporter [Oceanicoccus sp.]
MQTPPANTKKVHIYPSLRDFVAALSVALILVPQSIAYADLAGLPPVQGLFAATLPLIVAAIFGCSPWLQTGPVAMTSILTLGALSAISTPFTSEYVGMAALLALIVGITRVLIGLVKAGHLVYLMSQPVLNGFTTAAALVILTTQAPAFFGVEAASGNFFSRLTDVLMQPELWSIPGMVFGGVALLVIVASKRLHVLFPGVLVAVVAGIVFQSIYDCDCKTVGSFPTDFPSFSFVLPWPRFGELLIPGIMIALVGFAEPAAIARTLAASSRRPWSASKEFIGQGAANIAAGVIGAFPVGGSFSRTMVSHSAGATSRWSGALTGIIVLAFLPVANLMSTLPQPVLAAIIISAVYPLIKFGPMIQLARTSRAQAMIAWTTFLLTLLLSPRIDLALLLGMGMGVVVHLWREMRINVSHSYTEHTLWLEPVGVLFFGSAQGLDETLVDELSKHPEAKELILDLRRLGRIDYTGALVIHRIALEAEQAGLVVKVIPGQPPQGERLLKRVFGDDSRRILST